VSTEEVDCVGEVARVVGMRGFFQVGGMWRGTRCCNESEIPKGVRVG
jgi:hypothetical protein